MSQSEDLSGEVGDQVAPVSTGLCLGYGIGSLGTGLYSTVPGLLLLYFLTNIIGVPAALAGLAVFIPKTVDVVIDPVLGILSDRTRSRWGRRRPWLLAGALALPTFFFLMFSVPEFESVQARFLYVTLFFVAAALGFSLFQVPYIAMPAEMTPDTHDRTRIVSFRMVFVTIGILAGGAVAPLLVKLGGGGRAGYALMGAVLAAVVFVSMMTSFLGTAKAPSSPVSEEQPPAFAQLKWPLTNRPFRLLVLGTVFPCVGVSCLLACVPFYVQHVLQRDQEVVTLLFVALVLPAAVTMPLWVWLAKRLGKRRTYMLSVAAFGLLSLVFLIGTPTFVTPLYAVTALMGTAYAGTQLLPFSMLTDVIVVEGRRSGQAQEGVFTGLWTAVETAGFAFGALVAGSFLQWRGFVESMADQTVVQSGQAIQGIVWTMSLLPAFFLLAGLPFLWRYNVSESLR